MPKTKATVFATWKLPVDLRADAEELAARAVKQMADESPIGWTSDRSQGCGWDFRNGVTTIRFCKGWVVIHFEAPYVGRVPKEHSINPIQLQGTDADTWGLDEGGK